jgi:hypothetical protein
VRLIIKSPCDFECCEKDIARVNIVDGYRYHIVTTDGIVYMNCVLVDDTGWIFETGALVEEPQNA